MILPIVELPRGDATARRAALARPALEDQSVLRERMRATLEDVRRRGDAALIECAERYDGGAPVNLRVPQQEIDAALVSLTTSARAALQQAIDNVRLFHAAQRTEPVVLETMPGVRCERVLRPLDSVGLYVPGGSAPLPSALIMAAIPAEIAGVPRRVLCSPGNRAGRIDRVILATAGLLGLEEVYAIGGGQAIAGLAYGTQTLPKVAKIIGPGSAWVTLAKQLVAQDPLGAALDLPAGPSEVMVVADATARPAFVAADLLAQAEHDPLSQALLLTPSIELARSVREQALRQLESLSRRQILERSLVHSRLIVVADLNEALDLANDYAPEHLLLAVQEPRRWLERVQSAGSVFLGDWSPEPMGDYCSGTNHILPTFGYARAYSGLSVIDFIKRITVQELTDDGLRRLGPTARTLAQLEGLDAHARAVDIRLQALEASS